MDSRDRLTSAQAEVGEVNWMKKAKGLAKEHLCIPHGKG